MKAPGTGAAQATFERPGRTGPAHPRYRMTRDAAFAANQGGTAKIFYPRPCIRGGDFLRLPIKNETNFRRDKKP